MKILLSAYQCQPNTGSEDEVGWTWATELARMGHEVWVITWAECQLNVEQALQTNPIPNLHFSYCHHPTWFPWLFKVAIASRVPLLSVLLWQSISVWWQWDAYRRIAKPLTEQVAFDLVHHVTTASIRRPSFMGLLGVPFILGPLAGGESTPWRLRKSYPLRGLLLDLVRDVANGWVLFDPLMHLTFANASKIWCNSQQVQSLLPKRYRFKSQVQLVTGLENTVRSQTTPQRSTETEVFRILFVGRFLYWKGLHLGLRAFAQLRQKIPNSRLTAIGRGPDEKWLHGLAKQLGINNAVDWVPWLEQRELIPAYLQHDVLLFPSLHDSAPTVILEAFSHGLPVICLNLGGPGVMVDQTCGRVIRTDGLGEEAVIQALCDALTQLARNPELRTQLSEGALVRTSKFMRKNAAARIYPVRDLVVNQGDFNEVIPTN